MGVSENRVLFGVLFRGPLLFVDPKGHKLAFASHKHARQLTLALRARIWDVPPCTNSPYIIGIVVLPSKHPIQDCQYKGEPPKLAP